MVNRSNVISGGASDQHVVEGYRFKVISEFDNHTGEKNILKLQMKKMLIYL